MTIARPLLKFRSAKNKLVQQCNWPPLAMIMHETPNAVQQRV